MKKTTAIFALFLAAFTWGSARVLVSLVLLLQLVYLLLVLVLP